MSYPDEKLRALRRMKLVATGAFLLMTLLFAVSLQFDNEPIFWLVRWDYVNAFAEAAMIGALADWFAVVALFRHPLGIPIWHTAIIPQRKDEIGRNLAAFVETRLLSVENLSREIDRLSAAGAASAWLEQPGNREKVTDWAADGLGTLVRGFDDGEMRRIIGEMVTRRLTALDAAALLSGGLNLLVENGRHQQLVDVGLGYLASWLPSRREAVREFVQGAMKRTLKWGSKLVPDVMVDKATDRTLEALIDVLMAAAADKNHPLRADLNERILEWIARLEKDEEWRSKIDEWKAEALESPKLHEMIARFWDEGKKRLLDDLVREDSTARGYIRRAVDRLADRLREDASFREAIDLRLRTVITTFLGRHHGEIGAIVQRIIDSWDGERLAQEMELNLGKDLQYIRLNGTFIGGTVGLLLHLVR